MLPTDMPPPPEKGQNSTPKGKAITKTAMAALALQGLAGAK